MDVFLGLDLGTTNCKALIVDAGGRPVAHAAARTPSRAIGSGTMPTASLADVPEYDAGSLWETSAAIIHEALTALRPNQRVAAISICSMAEAGVLVDELGEPLAPILTWYSQRTLPCMDWWRARISDERVFGISGLSPDHTYSAHKLVWYREHAPEAFARARTWLCLADWITFCLTGERTTSHSMASRTMLFDIRARAWSQELLEAGGLSGNLMPVAVPSGQVVGHVTPAASRLTGLGAGTPVVAGGHDHMCGALAAGVVRPGMILDSAGTAEAVLVVLESPSVDARAAGSALCFGCHVVADQYYVLGGLMGGGVVNWLSRTFLGSDEAGCVTRMIAEAATSPPGANGLWFLPYLDGAGPPRRDPEAWGAWLGLRLRHTRADMLRAAMEGLSFSIRHLIDGMTAVTGVRSHGLRAVGGGTRIVWWQQLKANVLGIAIDAPDVADASAQGAALLATIGAGAFDITACATTAQPSSRYEVDEDESRRYDSPYSCFLELSESARSVKLLQ